MVSVNAEGGVNEERTVQMERGSGRRKRCTGSVANDWL